jgi:hypothetical protein
MTRQPFLLFVVAGVEALQERASGEETIRQGVLAHGRLDAERIAAVARTRALNAPRPMSGKPVTSMA